MAVPPAAAVAVAAAEAMVEEALMAPGAVLVAQAVTDLAFVSLDLCIPVNKSNIWRHFSEAMNTLMVNVSGNFLN